MGAQCRNREAYPLLWWTCKANLGPSAVECAIETESRTGRNRLLWVLFYLLVPAKNIREGRWLRLRSRLFCRWRPLGNVPLLGSGLAGGRGFVGVRRHRFIGAHGQPLALK